MTRRDKYGDDHAKNSAPGREFTRLACVMRVPKSFHDSSAGRSRLTRVRFTVAMTKEKLACAHGFERNIG
jgi:hypothetical protein